MTIVEMERRVKCAYKHICDRLVLLRASTYADPYRGCMCDTCGFYNIDKNAKPPLVKEIGGK